MSDTLRCGTCQRDLPDDDFSIDRKPCRLKRRFRRYECRECDSARSFLRSEQCERVVNAAKEVPCMDCGVQYPLCATDFDHVRGEKLFDLGNARGRAIQKVKDEIAKCDVVCANCHRIRTYKRGLEALARGESVGCIVPRGTRRAPKTQTPSLPDTLTLF